MTCKKTPRPLSARDSLPRVPFRQLSGSGFPGAHYCGRAHPQAVRHLGWWTHTRVPYSTFIVVPTVRLTNKLLFSA